MATETKKRLRLPWKWLILVLLVGGGGWWWWQQSSAASSKIEYETAPVTRGDVTSQVTATGSLQAVTKVTVGSEVSGIIKTILVDFNSRVSRGQVLARLDPSLFQTQLEQAQASLNNTQAGLNNAMANAGNALANVRSAEAGIASSRAKVETARAALANARAGLVTGKANVERSRAETENALRNFRRYETLLKKDLVAKSDRDQAETQYLMARANLDAQRAQISAAEATYRSAEAGLDAAQADLDAARIKRESASALLDAARAQVRSAEAQVRQSSASLGTARVNLSRTIIRSPINGIVLARNVNIGQTVAAQFQAPDLFTLAENLDLMQVETAVDESDVGRVKEGAKATFTVDAYPGETFEGNVAQLRQAPTTVQNVVTYQAIVQTRNKGWKLKPGMTATVNIHVETHKDVLLVPNAALRFKPPQEALGDADKGKKASPSASPSASPGAGRTGRMGGKARGERRSQSVWVISANPLLLEERKVTLGLTDGINTEIVKSDLKEGDKVVVSSEGGTRSGKGAGSKGPPRMFR